MGGAGIAQRCTSTKSQCAHDVNIDAGQPTSHDGAHALPLAPHVYHAVDLVDTVAGIMLMLCQHVATEHVVLCSHAGQLTPPMRWDTAQTAGETHMYTQEVP